MNRTHCSWVFIVALCLAANPPLAWADMKQPAPTCRLQKHEDITRDLREELLGKDTGVLDALYDVRGIQDAEVRQLVSESKRETARWLKDLREKLKPSRCELESERKQQSNYVIRFLINGDTRVELFVDDIREEGGCLRTHDQIRIKLLSGR